MNIAIFTHNYPNRNDDRKDAGIFIHDFVDELNKYHKVFVFCPDYKNKEKFGNWSFYNPLNLFKFLTNISFGVIKSLEFVKKNKIDYVLSAWAIPSGIYAFIAKIKYGVGYGVWYLGSDLNIYSNIPILKDIISLISKKADHLFANSYSLVKIAKLKYKKCDFLPASTAMRSAKVKKIRFKKSKINILYVGRLEKVKGIDLLVSVAKELSNEFQIRVIGDGTMRDIASSQQKNVYFLGQKGIEDISGYMKVSDFLLVPSRNESLPLVILEAANFNLPILASDVGDCKHVLDKYKVGDTFKSENLSQMVDKISKFDYKMYKRNGRFKDLVVDYSLEVSVKSFLTHISK